MWYTELGGGRPRAALAPFHSGAYVIAQTSHTFGQTGRIDIPVPQPAFHHVKPCERPTHTMCPVSWQRGTRPRRTLPLSSAAPSHCPTSSTDGCCPAAAHCVTMILMQLSRSPMPWNSYVALLSMIESEWPEPGEKKKRCEKHNGEDAR